MATNATQGGHSAASSTPPTLGSAGSVIALANQGLTSVEDTQQLADKQIRSLEAEDRSFALKFIIRGTVYFVFFIGLFILGSVALGYEWKEAASVLVEILKIGLLPLATFVLGQFFGSAKK